MPGQLGRGLEELLRGRAGERARVHGRAEVSLLCLRADWEGHEQERKDTLTQMHFKKLFRTAYN